MDMCEEGDLIVSLTRGNRSSKKLVLSTPKYEMLVISLLARDEQIQININFFMTVD